MSPSSLTSAVPLDLLKKTFTTGPEWLGEAAAVLLGTAGGKPGLEELLGYVTQGKRLAASTYGLVMSGDVSWAEVVAENLNRGKVPKARVPVALRRLIQAGNSSASKAAKQYFAKDNPVEIRRQAASYLCLLVRAKDAEARGLVLAGLKDADEGVKRRCLAIAGLCKLEEAAPAAVEMMFSNNRRWSACGLHAVRMIGSKEALFKELDKVWPQMKGKLEREKLFKRICIVLGSGLNPFYIKCLDDPYAHIGYLTLQALLRNKKNLARTISESDRKILAGKAIELLSAKYERRRLEALRLLKSIARKEHIPALESALEKVRTEMKKLPEDKQKSAKRIADGIQKILNILRKPK